MIAAQLIYFPGIPSDIFGTVFDRVGFIRMDINESPISPAITMTKEERDWSMWSHFSTLSVLAGIPGFIGPAVIWYMKKDESAVIAEQAKESLNFQISMFIYLVISAVLMLVLIGFVLFPIVLIADIVLAVIAGVRAGEGVAYRYPMTIRFL